MEALGVVEKDPRRDPGLGLTPIGVALEIYIFRERHSYSMNTLSIQRPRAIHRDLDPCGLKLLEDRLEGGLEVKAFSERETVDFGRPSA